MANKVVQRAFVKPSWSRPDEVEAFLVEAGDFDAGDIVRAYDALTKLYGQITQNAYKLACMALIGLVQRKPSRELFAPLVKGLKTPNGLLVETLGHVLPLVNNPAEHGLLITLLGDGAPPVRQAAQKLLARVARPATVDALVQVCRGRGFAGRLEALEVAKSLGVTGLPVFSIVLASPDPDEVVAAMTSLTTSELVTVAPHEVLGVLEPYLGAPDDTVATRALGVFGSLCDEETFFEKVVPHVYDPRPARVRAALYGLARFPGRSAIATLEFKFHEGPEDVRFAVLSVLERMATDDVLPLLVTGIASSDLKVQSEAVRVLRALTAAAKLDVARTLLWLMRHESVQVRRMAAEVASAVRDKKGEVWPKLVRFLRDEDWWVRERVLDALVELAGRELTPHLASLLDDPSAGARRVAVEGMGRVRDPAALGALVRAADGDADWWVREEAIRAIGRVKDNRAVPYIHAFLAKNDDRAVACIDTLREISPSSSEQVKPFLGADEAEKRLAALRYFEAHGSAALAEVIRPLAFDTEREVSQRARDLLDAWAVKLFSEKAGEDDPTRILDQLLERVVVEDGDDLIVNAGRRVSMKQRGKVIPMTKHELSAEQTYVLLSPLLSTAQAESLGRLVDVDFSYYSPTAGCRFRVNVFRAQFGLGAVFRRVRSEVIPFETLNLPPTVKRLATYKNGLVLVGGPPGSGKSTTLAALIDLINREQSKHIITVEDPIEGVHKSEGSLINQREIGTDTMTFDLALRSMLRMDPDVILIGELRDFATIEFALRAAETGHLVFGTVHTFSADATVERLVAAHPGERRDQARAMLADNLRAVLCQFLFEDRRTPGARVIAAELMFNNDPVAAVIRKNQAYQIPSIIQTSKELGMTSMDAALRALFEQGAITSDDLYVRLRNKDLYESITGEVPLHKLLAADGSLRGAEG